MFQEGMQVQVQVNGGIMSAIILKCIESCNRDSINMISNIDCCVVKLMNGIITKVPITQCVPILNSKKVLLSKEDKLNAIIEANNLLDYLSVQNIFNLSVDKSDKLNIDVSCEGYSSLGLNRNNVLELANVFRQLASIMD